jgi:DNA repair protein RadC
LTNTQVHPREVFKQAIRQSASGVILAHNHPSGDSVPSDEDLYLTERLVEAGQIIGIHVIDHIIVGEDSYYSFRDNELL